MRETVRGERHLCCTRVHPAYMHGMELFRPELHGLQYLEHVPRTYHFVNIDI